MHATQPPRASSTFNFVLVGWGGLREGEGIGAGGLATSRGQSSSNNNNNNKDYNSISDNNSDNPQQPPTREEPYLAEHSKKC